MNQQKKQITATLLAGVLATALSACGDGSDASSSGAPNDPASPSSSVSAPVVTPTPTPTATPTPAPTPTPTSTPTPTPTATPTPTPTPTATPTPAPSGSGCGVALNAAAITSLFGGNLVSSANLQNYVVGLTGSASPYTLDATQTATSPQFICGYDNTASPTSSTKLDTVTAEGSIIGAFTVPKAAVTSSADDGGQLVLRLPSVSVLALGIYATGSINYRVQTSTDGVNWSTTLGNKTGVKLTNYVQQIIGTSGSATAGDSTLQAGAITTPVWVRISNAGTGTLNVTQIQIAP
ncbi:hypothetical protein [Silvimonas amylolytica]|uniref:Uncharacterized protein n=1 Tax=Silvimonas amylolytica TaxID=449663 RepID=A0ABQ2PKY7_9NEIS|nr:hypothetical protein [Silvimonas amylolytica]GGP26035.1 hypothetical protein GCM10010971_18540 [Silvimonas amylolytica]